MLGLSFLSIPPRANIFAKAVMLFLLVATPTTVLSQSRKNEFNTGYGTLASSRALNNSIDHVVTTPMSSGMTSAGRLYTGTFHISYKYRDDASQHLPMTVGAAFMYEQTLSGAFAGNITTGRFIDNFYTVLGEVNLIYVNRRRLQIYGVMGAGVTLCTRRFTSNEDEADSIGAIHLNFQLSPVCVKYGENAGIFVELGLGSKGVACAGMFVRL
jgi:hypothetical protein